MNEQTVKLIQDLADKLGTTTEFLVQVYAKQASIMAWWWLAVVVVVIILCVVFSLSIWRHLNNMSPEKRDSEDVTCCNAMILILSLTTIFSMCNLSDDILGGLFNPEYLAIHEIIHSIR